MSARRLACNPCRKARIGCDASMRKGSPCSNCVRRGKVCHVQVSDDRLSTSIRGPSAWHQPWGTPHPSRSIATMSNFNLIPRTTRLPPNTSLEPKVMSTRSPGLRRRPSPVSPVAVTARSTHWRHPRRSHLLHGRRLVSSSEHAAASKRLCFTRCSGISSCRSTSLASLCFSATVAVLMLE